MKQPIAIFSQAPETAPIAVQTVSPQAMSIPVLNAILPIAMADSQPPVI